MKGLDQYFLNLNAMPTKYIARLLTDDSYPKGGTVWEITNEIKPVDLYCYLYAKYGEPNGLQNFFRHDDSDNLIHWEWVLSGDLGFTTIQGHNFRSEIHLAGNLGSSKLSLSDFVSQVKLDIGNYGKQISQLRNKLEKWQQFLNPYKQISEAIEQQYRKIEELKLNLAKDKIPQATSPSDFKKFKKRWENNATKYSFAVGLAYGARAMLPVQAESFISLLLFVLSKPEIKKSERLFQNVLRQPIDIRVQSLHINCNGFQSPVDYESPQCKAFHTLMNERNDLLHGNVDLNKLGIGNVFFNGKVPIFISYEDSWDKTIGVSTSLVRLESLNDDRRAVKNFIEYLLSLLNPAITVQVESIVNKSQLGFNHATGRVGVLFPDHLVDFRAIKGKSKSV
ncbi:MAG: hypothetical protein CL600_15165 [Alteromonas sp.]|nr:hypothetical protein [Alteromonas sp.]